mgnify:CR=1 FL=1
MSIPPINLNNLDFNGIKNNIKTYISSKPEFTDFNYEGSALSTVIDLLTYSTYYQLIFQNILVNEMFLDSAQKLESIKSHAKVQGFLVQNKFSAKSNVTATRSSSSATINKYDSFTGRNASGIIKTFYVLSDVSFSSNEATFDIFEGQNAIIKKQFTPDVTNQSCFIPDQSFDFRTLSVEVNINGTDNENDYITYRRGNSVEPNINQDSKVFYLESFGNGFLVKFIGGIINPETGETPGEDTITENTKIRITYIIPSGSAGNGVSQFNSTNDSINLVSNVTSAGGRENTSAENLKLFVPRTFASQERLVTETDIKTGIVNSNFTTSMDNIILVNGANLTTPEPGTIYVKLTTTVNESELIEYLTNNGVLGVNFVYGDPPA